MLVPEVRPNPRDDTYVTDANFRDSRRTVYSGRLVFGAPAQRGTAMSRMDFAGPIWLPDSLSYRADRAAEALVSADTWVQSVGEYLFVPAAGALLATDPQQPGIAWVQLGMTVQGYSGAIIGYRVTVTAGRDAFAG
jgi:hypothetical protein